jgi:hypothetical protein
MRILRIVAVLSTSSALSIAAISPAAGGDGPVQDGRIAKQIGQFKGALVINETGKHQTVTKTVAPGATAVFYVKTKNLGGAPEDHAEGSGSSPCFDVRYFTAFIGGIDVTASVVAGVDGTIPPGTTFKSRFEVTVSSCAPEGDVKTVKLDWSPVNPPRSHDRVRARVVVG